VRSSLFVAVALVLVVLIGGAAAVWAYDASREDRIASGVTVGGVAVGGLEVAQARAKLERELVAPLREPVVVEARHRRFRLTAERARVRADLDAMVDEALARSRRGNVLARTWRELTGGEVRADVEPRISFSRAAVRRLVRRVARATEREPRDAKVDFSAGSLKKVASRYGIRMYDGSLRRRVEHALRQPDPAVRTVRVRLRKVHPKVTTAKLARRYPIVVTVDRGGFRLRLFKRLRLVKTYPIAVGQVGLETPAGLYSVQNKAVNPAWNVPNSAWAGELAGRVIPGGTPENPLKARWLGIFDGAGIHGTDQVGSIGTNASHGCIRMLIPDVIELYDQVPVGAPVYIA
jgi:lipoprotein-anchoring transpeptidase ErfK/SrfK